MKILEQKVVPFGHLHTHTEYSLKDSALRVNEAVDKALELGMNFLAITEHGNMHSVYKFYNACMDTGKQLVDMVGEELEIDKEELKKIKNLMPRNKNMKFSLRDVEELKPYQAKYPKLFQEVLEREVKPIIGVEAYTIPTKEMVESTDKAVNSRRDHLVILAKDETGYKQLIKAVSESYLFQHKTTQSVFPRMTYDLMEKHFKGGHVIALSSCIQGEIPRHLLEGDYEGAKEKARFFENIFGKGNFFIELQNHGLEDELEVLPQLIQLSNDTDIPLVATNDVHYSDKEKARVRDMLVALRFHTSIYTTGFERDCEELYMKSYEEMMELFKSTPEAISNTVKIANMCEIEFIREKRFPHFKTPPHISEAEYLVQLSEKGIYERFPNFDTMKKKYQDMIRDRMKRELKTINNLGYAGYLLIVQDFIREGKEKGLVGPGRGSAAGSLVCYLIGITDVNPLKHDLIFERFLNEDRVSDPDIDTDFDHNRDDVIEYVKGKYGESSVCSIVTFGTFAARASVRNAGRATGKSQSLCDRIAKMIPDKPGITLEQALKENPKLKEEYEEKRDVESLLDDAALLEGLVSHTGIHAAGIIIADQDISNYIPLIYDQKERLWVAQFDMNQCEADAGLLKMDFLGLKNLSIIGGTLRDIEKNHGIKLTLDDIDMGNKEELSVVIREIFAKGRTKAIFQFESHGMVSLLKRFRPSNIEDLILLNAAYRPGPMQYIDELIEVKHGRKKATYITPEMEEILGETYGKPIYQEQIMRIFNEVAGFSLGESDIIRRAMAKQKSGEMAKYLPKLKKELIKKGATISDAEKFSEELVEFSNYAFNKSHSAAYSYIAYYTAWLKHFYPEEYMANVLNWSSLKEQPVYIKESRDMGIDILPPSINESGMDFTPVEKGVIRFGLGGIKNVGKAREDIINDRLENGPYKNVPDYVKRMVNRNSRGVYKQVLESLIYAGAIDGLGYNRHQLIEGTTEYVKVLKDYLKKEETAKRQDTKDRAKEKVDNFKFDPFLNEFSKDHILDMEKKYLGFYASGHPLDDYKEIIEKNTNIFLGEIDEFDNRKNIVVVGQINSFVPLYTRADGAPMGKFILEDLTGEMECIVFPGAFEDCEEAIQEDSVVILEGQAMVEVEDENVDIQINVQKITPVTSAKRVYMRLNNIFDWKGSVEALVAQHPGSDPLFIYFEDEKQVFESKMRVRGSLELEKEFTDRFGKDNYVVLGS